MKSVHMKINRPKLQPINTKAITPIKGSARPSLELGIWSFSGAWMLVLGAFTDIF
jgi:hypothetical protein